MLISPNTWGTMRISKHNYAIELAKQGNKVYFVNPLNADNSSNTDSLIQSNEFENIFIINLKVPTTKWRLYLHYKMQQTWLYDLLLKKKIKVLAKKNHISFTQVWNFEPNYHGLYHQYSKGRKIFFIADQINHPIHLRNAKRANLVVSVANEILAKFKNSNNNCLLINHGLNDVYEEYAQNKLTHFINEEKVLTAPKKKICVGYIGNLLIPALCYDALTEIVNQNPQVDFHFWGAYTNANNNLIRTDETLPNVSAIHKIKETCKNTFFYGPQPAKEIVKNFTSLDAFIYINSSEKDINGGANAHKILEYLSSGKVIVSTYLSFYENNNGLIEMTSKSDEKKYAAFFKQIVEHIDKYNTIENQQRRIKYALENTYKKNVEKILSKLKN